MCKKFTYLTSSVLVLGLALPIVVTWTHGAIRGLLRRDRSRDRPGLRQGSYTYST